jgi:hypothetical protein
VPTLVTTSSIQNFAIAYLTIDGNRFAFSDPNNPNDSGRGCFSGAYNSYIDVNATGAVTGLVYYVSLYNAPGVAIELLGSEVVEYSTIWNPRTTGIHLYGNNAWVAYSYIYQAGTAAITAHASGAGILTNYLWNNRYEQPDNVAGGQLVLDEGSSNAVVDYNTIDGNDYRTANPVWITDHLNGGSYSCIAVAGLGVDGIEGYGSGHGLYDNNVWSNTNTGMILKGTNGWLYSGYSYYYPDHSHSVKANGFGVRFMYDSQTGQSNTNLVLDHPVIQSNTTVGLSLENFVGSSGGWIGPHSGACIEYNGTVNIQAPAPPPLPSQYNWSYVDLNSCN